VVDVSGFAKRRRSLKKAGLAVLKVHKDS